METLNLVVYQITLKCLSDIQAEMSSYLSSLYQSEATFIRMLKF
jgi:hypothetical protein